MFGSANTKVGGVLKGDFRLTDRRRMTSRPKETPKVRQCTIGSTNESIGGNLYTCEVPSHHKSYRCYHVNDVHHDGVHVNDDKSRCRDHVGLCKIKEQLECRRMSVLCANRPRRDEKREREKVNR